MIATYVGPVAATPLNVTVVVAVFVALAIAGWWYR